MVPKEFWKSRTLWFNILSLIVLVVGAFGFDEFVADSRVADLAAGIVAVISLLTPLVNMLLRTITTQPVKFRQ